VSKEQLPPTADLILYEVRRALAAMGVEDRDQILAEVECRIGRNREFPSVWPHRTADAVRRAVRPCFAERANVLLDAVFGRDFAIEPRFSFEMFMEAGNAEVVQRVRALADAALSRTSAKPAFLLHGESGVGKTHLLFALANEVLRRDPHARVSYLAAETWQIRWIAARRADVPFVMPSGFDAVLIDDLDGVAGKVGFREELGSFVAHLASEGTQVVLSAIREFDGLGNTEAARLGQPSRDSLTLWLQARAAQRNIPMTRELCALAASALTCFEIESILQRYELRRSIGGNLLPETNRGENV